MIPFITFRELHDGQLHYYVLQKDFPHYLARVSTNPFEDALLKSPIPQYNMYVVLEGTLRGAVVPGYKDTLQEIETCLHNMACWYYAERISEEPKRFKKFKINSNAAISTE